jgi:hypothetical protein
MTGVQHAVDIAADNAARRTIPFLPGFRLLAVKGWYIVAREHNNSLGFGWQSFMHYHQPIQPAEVKL